MSDTLEDNVRYLLSKCPFTIRDLSGERTGMRGREDLVGTLAITFLHMQKLASDDIPGTPMYRWTMLLKELEKRFPSTPAEIVSSSEMPEERYLRKIDKVLEQQNGTNQSR